MGNKRPRAPRIPGHRIVDTGAGGNCLFSSIAHQLRRVLGMQLTHAQVRAQIVKHMRTLYNQNATFPGNDLLFRDIPGMTEAYLNEMATDGAWGSAVEVAVATTIWNVSVATHTQSARDPVIDGDPLHPRVRLFWHDWGHYQSVVVAEVEQNGTQDSTPPVAPPSSGHSPRRSLSALFALAARQGAKSAHNS